MARQAKTPRPQPAPHAGAGARACSTPAAVAAALAAAPRYLSPAVALCMELERHRVFQPEDILRIEPQIEQAIATVEKETREITAAAAALRASSPAAALEVPAGF